MVRIRDVSSDVRNVRRKNQAMQGWIDPSEYELKVRFATSVWGDRTAL